MSGNTVGLVPGVIHSPTDIECQVEQLNLTENAAEQIQIPDLI